MICFVSLQPNQINKNMKFTIFDIETDGLLDTVSKIHCLSWLCFDTENGNITKGSITDYQEIRDFVNPKGDTRPREAYL